ncbi:MULTISPECIES: ATP-dependent helicase [Alphaproteobacteria]|uniref:ATP-dependent helicase n=1 Tax=Alphaproteobacteria TaxID=28211 RepID=UPI003266B2A6
MRPRRANAAYLEEAKTLAGNAGQQDAYDSEGNCVVLAGPGSGKTKTLVLKLARILAEDVDEPRGVACITYSQQCARELGRRLEVLGLRNQPNLFVGTVHGFCLRHILMPYAQLAGLPTPNPIALATTQQARSIYKSEAERVLGVRQPYKFDDAGRYRRVHLDRSATGWRSDRDLVRIIEAYETALRARGLLDFDDLVVFGNRLVSEFDWVLPIIQAQFPVLAVDEYQDLGVPLHRIVERLVFNGGVRLFAVGDSDQSIYGFAGADGDLLRQLSEKPGIEAVRLRLNYRSAARIVQASEFALGEVRGYQPNDAARRATIDFVECPHGLEEQATVVIEKIIPAALKAKTGRKIGDIAVLYRTAPIGDVVANVAAAANIDFIRVDTAAPYRKNALTSWIEDCASWCSGGWRKSKPQLGGLLASWVQFRHERPEPRVIQQERARLTSFLWSWRSDDADAAPFVSAIRADLVDPLAGAEPALQDQFEEVNRMSEALKEDGTLAGLDLVSLGGRDGSPRHLNMLTLHSAKGCEYDVVVMVGMDVGNMPWQNESPKELQESRRLFYVGLTRARDEVHMLYSGWVKDRRYGRREYGRSPFVEELERRLAEVDPA